MISAHLLQSHLLSSGLIGSIPSPSFQDLSLGPFSFRMYGLVIALGVLAAVAIARRRFAARGGDPEEITTVAIVAVPAGLVGARLYHVITDFGDKYSDGRWWPDAFLIWQGGLGIPGGVALGALAAILVAKRQRLDWRHLADAAAPAIPVAQAIGRLGNWFNQELYGRPTDLPWALEIDAPVGFPPGTTFHPTFLYEGLWNLALAATIVLLGRRVVLRAGRWFAVYVVGYGLGRLWVESLRIDFATEIAGLRVNTWISLVAIGGGLLWLFWRGSPIDADATAALRRGEDPLAHVAAPREQLHEPGEDLGSSSSAGDSDEASSGEASSDEASSGEASSDDADSIALDGEGDGASSDVAQGPDEHGSGSEDPDPDPGHREGTGRPSAQP